MILYLPLQKYQTWVANVCSPAPQPKEPQPKGLIWLQSMDNTTRASTRASCTKGPVIEVDLNDDANEVDEESSSKADDVEAGGFELRKHAHGEGTSTSSAAG